MPLSDVCLMSVCRVHRA